MTTSFSQFQQALKGRFNLSRAFSAHDGFVLFFPLAWKKETPSQPPDFARAIRGGSKDWKCEQGPFPKIGTCRDAGGVGHSSRGQRPSP